MKQTSHKYNAGDIVRIVDKPYYECPFTWVEPMSVFCGQVTTIRGVHWSNRLGCWSYYLDADDGMYSWCENCLMAASEIEDTAFIAVLCGGEFDG